VGYAPNTATDTFVTPGDLLSWPQDRKTILIAMAVRTDGVTVTVRPVGTSAEEDVDLPAGATVYTEHDYYTDALYALASRASNEDDYPGHLRDHYLASAARVLRRPAATEEPSPSDLWNCRRPEHNIVSSLSGYVVWTQGRGEVGLSGIRVLAIISDASRYALAREVSRTLRESQSADSRAESVIGMSYLYNGNACWHP